MGKIVNSHIAGALTNRGGWKWWAFFIIAMVAADCGVPIPTETLARLTNTEIAPLATKVWEGNILCVVSCQMQDGDIGYVRLEVIENLPARWKVGEIDTTILELIAEPEILDRASDYSLGPIPPGAPAYADQIIRFKAIHAGKTIITLNLIDGSNTRDTYSVTVTIH